MEQYILFSHKNTMRKVLRGHQGARFPQITQQTWKTRRQTSRIQAQRDALKPLDCSAHPCASPCLDLHSWVSCPMVAKAPR